MASGLTLRRFENVEDFEARALPFLVEREAENNLFLGICANIRAGRYSDPYLCVVEQGDDVVGAAFRTPPHQLGLSHIVDAEALGAIAEDVRAAFETLPGVVGRTDDARAFAQAWSEITGQRFTVGMNQRIYETEQAHAPEGVNGEFRDATPAERDLLVDWVRAFHDEAGGILTSAEEAVDFRLGEEYGGLVIWWDGSPVSMAGYGGPTPNGARVGPVYTPRELRGRGYASACTAALTKRLLDSGRRFVFLYTDLANPTSNSIYQKIGYRPVCDVDQYRFE
jgi:hypothetical protein